MKHYLNFLLIAMVVSFVACDKNKNEPQKANFFEDESIRTQGLMTVKLDDTTNFEYSIDSVIFSFGKEYVKIDMKKVKFSPQMPISLDMTIDSVAYYIDNNDEAILSGNNIVPKALGGPFPQYTITNLSGKCGFNYEFTMMCGKYPVEYNGGILLTK